MAKRGKCGFVCFRDNHPLANALPATSHHVRPAHFWPEKEGLVNLKVKWTRKLVWYLTLKTPIDVLNQLFVWGHGMSYPFKLIYSVETQIGSHTLKRGEGREAGWGKEVRAEDEECERERRTNRKKQLQSLWRRPRWKDHFSPVLGVVFFFSLPPSMSFITHADVCPGTAQMAGAGIKTGTVWVPLPVACSKRLGH